MKNLASSRSNLFPDLKSDHLTYLLSNTRKSLLNIYVVFTLVVAFPIVIFYWFYYNEIASFCLLLTLASSICMFFLLYDFYKIARFLFAYIVPLIWIWASYAYDPNLGVAFGLASWLCLLGLLFQKLDEILILVGVHFLYFLAAHYVAYLPGDNLFSGGGFLEKIGIFIPLSFMVFFCYSKFVDTSKSLNSQVKKNNVEIHEANQELESTAITTVGRINNLNTEIGERIRNDIGQELVLLKMQIQLENADSKLIEKLDHCIEEVRVISNFLYPRNLELFGFRKSMNSFIDRLNKLNGTIIFETDFEGETDKYFNAENKFKVFKLLSLVAYNLENHAEIKNCVFNSKLYDNHIYYKVIFDGEKIDKDQFINVKGDPGIKIIQENARLYGFIFDLEWDEMEGKNMLMISKLIDADA